MTDPVPARPGPAGGPRTRYTVVARWYDLLSAEPFYHDGRRLAVPLLRLRPGDTVLDLGCGTGSGFALLSRALGPTGRIAGIDADAGMLAQARRRRQEQDGPEVVLHRCDATTLPLDELLELTGRPVDAVIAAYSLSLMADRRAAFRLAHEVTRPLGRIAVVDMQRPSRRAARPLAALAMAAGGSDPTASPWSEVERTCTEVEAPTASGAHVQVRVGTRPAP